MTAATTVRCSCCRAIVERVEQKAAAAAAGVVGLLLAARRSRRAPTRNQQRYHASAILANTQRFSSHKVERARERKSERPNLKDSTTTTTTTMMPPPPPLLLPRWSRPAYRRTVHELIQQR